MKRKVTKSWFDRFSVRSVRLEEEITHEDKEKEKLTVFVSDIFFKRLSFTDSCFSLI